MSDYLSGHLFGSVSRSLVIHRNERRASKMKFKVVERAPNRMEHVVKEFATFRKAAEFARKYKKVSVPECRAVL